MVWPRVNAKIHSISTWKKSQKQEIQHLASLDWDVRNSSILNAFAVFALSTYALVFDLTWSDLHSHSTIRSGLKIRSKLPFENPEF